MRPAAPGSPDDRPAGWLQARIRRLHGASLRPPIAVSPCPPRPRRPASDSEWTTTTVLNRGASSARRWRRQSRRSSSTERALERARPPPVASRASYCRAASGSCRRPPRPRPCPVRASASAGVRRRLRPCPPQISCRRGAIPGSSAAPAGTSQTQCNRPSRRRRSPLLQYVRHREGR